LSLDKFIDGESQAFKRGVFFVKALLMLTIFIIAPVGSGISFAGEAAEGGAAMGFSLLSDAFKHEGTIPVRHTCDGENTSPPLKWTGLPEGTKSLVLIVDDPDAPDPKAPKMTWVHWVLYNIPADAQGLAGAVKRANLPAGTMEGFNDWRKRGFGGPCPPVGRHRYFHKLYALDSALPDLGNPGKADVEKAMKGKILGEAVLIGTYTRSR